MQKNLLLVFVKNPELGKCKTRLAATIGDEKALTFYKNMLQHTKPIVEDVTADKQIYYSAYVDRDDLWPNDGDFSKQLQESGDLGDKMKASFKAGFKAGYERICIIGSDCYAITPTLINGAFRVLESKDAVLGPSTDGGYYLVGMQHLIPEIFEGKNWSTESVTPDTLKDFETQGKSYALLIALTDIDTEADLITIPVAARNLLLSEK
jgi:hypothetical protein